MGLVDDDSIALVPNTAKGPTRAVTPSSASRRCTTPKRFNSAPRSNSASKGVDIAKAIVDAQSAVNRIRCSSRRKLRRWENDNLFGVHRYLNANSFRGPEDTENVVEESNQIEWRSNFSTLLKKENAVALRAYLSCSNSESVLPYRKTTKSASTTITDPRKCWAKVEKKLRSIVIRSVQNQKLKEYLISMEEILCDYKLLGDISHSEHALDSIKSYVTTSIGCSEYGLEISLVDSAFHRLLLHALCQFHGLKSKVSIAIKIFNECKNNQIIIYLSADNR